MKTPFFVLLFLLTAVPAPSARAALATPTPIPVYDTLANRRPLLQLPAYTAAEKQLVANQALYFIENYYVHRAQKEAAFGVDPLGELRSVQQAASSLSDQELHGRIQNTFSSLRDLHTNYYFPKPFQCYRTALPVSVERVQDASGNFVVAISSASTSADIVRLAPDLIKISVGDVLESFSDQDPLIAAAEFNDAGAGANPNAQIRRSLQTLTSRSHVKLFTPANDSEHLKLLKPDGSHYEVDLPWISIATLSCLNPSSTKREKITNKRERDEQGRDQGVDEEQLEFNQFFASSHTENSFGAYISTTEPSIRYQVLNNANGSFGVIKLDSFAPSKETTDTSLEIIANLLSHQLLNTKGLIIDLRNNGGGTISYGERMEQLFTPKHIETEDFQMLANQANHDFITAAQTNLNYLPLIDQAMSTGANLTGFAKLTPVVNANALGQTYLKPVIVLTNSACFSTCDMFTAGMQDNGAATIISTDGQTGGGGANVWVYSDFAKNYPAGAANPFLKLPASQDMRVAWRRSVRVGRNNGAILENAGAVADETIPMQLQDLITPDSELYNTVTKRLADQYQLSFAANTQVMMDTASRFDYMTGDTLNIPLSVSGTSLVQFYTNGVLLDEVMLGAESANLMSTVLKVQSSSLSSLPDLSSIELIGKLNLDDGSTQKVWRKVISLRRIPSQVTVLPAEINFNTSSLAPFSVVSSVASGASVWTLANQTMRVGSAGNYGDNTHTEASLFAQVPSNGMTRLDFTGELHSEKNYDFFSVSVFESGHETVLIAPMSGDVAQKDYSFDLSAFNGKKIEVRFTFTSDSGENSTGPSISKMNLRVALP